MHKLFAGWTLSNQQSMDESVFLISFILPPKNALGKIHDSDLSKVYFTDNFVLITFALHVGSMVLILVYLFYVWIWHPQWASTFIYI